MTKAIDPIITTKAFEQMLEALKKAEVVLDGIMTVRREGDVLDVIRAAIAEAEIIRRA